MVRFADDPEVRHRIVFLPNYDIAMAQPLYPGCDVWLNNPLRPYEACGTSGMKAALNGGLNLSILDGWWDEWYDGSNGWAIPSADGVDDPDRRDDLEATALYDLIENEVAPALLRRRRRRRPDPLARDGAAHAEVARPQGARHPDGPRLRAPALHARRASPAASSTPTTPAPRAGGVEAAGPRRLARRPRRPRREQRRRRRPGGRHHADRARVRRRSASSTPDDVDVQVVHGVINAEDELVDSSVEQPVAGREPTRAAGTGSTAASRSTAAAPSATPSGSCRSNDLLASPAELGVVALPA